MSEFTFGMWFGFGLAVAGFTLAVAVLYWADGIARRRAGGEP